MIQSLSSLSSLSGSSAAALSASVMSWMESNIHLKNDTGHKGGCQLVHHCKQVFSRQLRRTRSCDCPCPSQRRQHPPVRKYFPIPLLFFCKRFIRVPLWRARVQRPVVATEIPPTLSKDTVLELVYDRRSNPNVNTTPIITSWFQDFDVSWGHLVERDEHVPGYGAKVSANIAFKRNSMFFLVEIISLIVVNEYGAVIPFTS